MTRNKGAFSFLCLFRKRQFVSFIKKIQDKTVDFLKTKLDFIRHQLNTLSLSLSLSLSVLLQSLLLGSLKEEEEEAKVIWAFINQSKTWWTNRLFYQFGLWLPPRAVTTLSKPSKTQVGFTFISPRYDLEDSALSLFACVSCAKLYCRF